MKWVAWFVFSAVFGFSQTPKALRPRHIEGHLMYDNVDVSGSGQRMIKIINTKTNKIKQMICPINTLSRDVFEGKVYVTTRPVREGDLFRSSLYCRLENEWVRLGDILLPWRGLYSIMPLGNGKYFAISDSPNFSKNNGHFPFAILKLSKDSFEIDEVVDAPFSGPVWKRKPGVMVEFEPMFTTQMFSFSMFLSVMRVQDRIVLYSENIGYLFVFKSENGNHIHTKVVYDGLDAKVLMDADLQSVGLGSQPMHDGTILMATRDENGCILSGKIASRHAGSNPSESDYGEKRLKSFEAGLSAFPNIVWWRYDPADNTLVKFDTPDDMPTRLKSFEALWAFAWRLAADDKVEIFNESEPITLSGAVGKTDLGVLKIR